MQGTMVITPSPPVTRPFTAVGAENRLSFNVVNQVAATTKDDLTRVHTVPDPYYVTSQFEQTTDTKIIKFVNLPADCIIRIYSSSGVLVDLLEHHSTRSAAQRTGTCATATIRSSRAGCTSITSKPATPGGSAGSRSSTSLSSSQREGVGPAGPPHPGDGKHMSHTTARNLALMAALLSGLPAAAMAQGDINQDNTRLRHHVGRVPALWSGARGTALGGAFSAIATDVSALYYNPGRHRADAPGGRHWSAPTTMSPTPAIAGAASRFRSAAARGAVGIQIGTFGFKDQQVYTAEQPEGTGSVYSVSETFAGLTFSQNFSDRFSAGVTAKGMFDNLGSASGNAFAVDFGTSFHAALSGHPVRFSFVVANLGTNLSYSGEALRDRRAPGPHSGGAGRPVRTPSRPSSGRQGITCPPSSGWVWHTI